MYEGGVYEGGSVGIISVSFLPPIKSHSNYNNFVPLSG